MSLDRWFIVADRVLLSADRNNVEECIDLAVEHDLGIEVMAFAYPDILDGSWENTVATYRAILRRVPGPITLHGPFMDLVSGSPDERINQVSFQRYQHAIHITSDLNAELLVLHANFIGSLHNPVYRQGWHQRNMIFWEQLAEYARPRGVTIRTEGYTVGMAVGAAYLFSPAWSFGAAVRYGSWFLPEKPAKSPFGDEASLRGQVNLFSFGINVAYRVPL